MKDVQISQQSLRQNILPPIVVEQTYISIQLQLKKQYKQFKRQ